MVELNVGIVCACMPSMANIIKRVAPKLLGSKATSDHYHSKGTGRLAYGRDNTATKSTGGSTLKGANGGSVSILHTQNFVIESDDEESLFSRQQNPGFNGHLVPLKHLGPTAEVHSPKNEGHH
jgi:hypothetical protein